MSIPLIAGYELRNSNLQCLTTAVLRFNDPSALVDDVRRGVLKDNSKTFLRRYDHGLLDVYPPGSDPKTMEDRNQALKPLTALQSLLHILDKNLIVIARSLPLDPYGDREHIMDKFLSFLEPQLEIDPRVIKLIKKRDRLLRRVELACRDEQDAFEIYHDAQRTFGTSTKNNIIATHGNHDLKINGEFEIPQESSSVFYIAWAAGIPCILKFPESASMAHLEYQVYQKIIDPRKQHLVQIELIEFTNLPIRHSNQSCALKMPRYDSTLQSCAQDPELGTLFEHVAVSVFDGLCAIHTTEYCHLDVKPGNIFIDSKGGVFLGDFDAALIVGRVVDRTTPTFLPRELAILKARGLLIANQVVDFGMLACTLMYVDVHTRCEILIFTLDSRDRICDSKS